MADRKIQLIWQNAYETFLSSGQFLSDVQKKVSHAILNCKAGSCHPYVIKKNYSNLPLDFNIIYVILNFIKYNMKG